MNWKFYGLFFNFICNGIEQREVTVKPQMYLVCIAIFSILFSFAKLLWLVLEFPYEKGSCILCLNLQNKNSFIMKFSSLMWNFVLLLLLVSLFGEFRMSFICKLEVIAYDKKKYKQCQRLKPWLIVLFKKLSKHTFDLSNTENICIQIWLFSFCFLLDMYLQHKKDIFSSPNS